MRLKITQLLLVILLLSCGTETKKEVNKEVKMGKEFHKIMFYNVENLFDTFDDEYTFDDDFLPESSKNWDTEKFKTKLDRLSEVILAIDKQGPLLIGMVEIENGYVIDQLLDHQRFRNINYNFAHFESPDERGIDVALIYDEDHFTVLEAEPLRVSLPENDKTRDILYVKGLVTGDERPLHVFVNHWPSRREGEKKSEPKRITAAKTVRSKIDYIQELHEEARILVMGDFNDYPNSKSIKKYLKAIDHHNISEEELFNLAARLDKDDQGSYNYRGDWGMMDQMMVSKPMLSKNEASYYVKQKELKIFNEDWIMYYDKKYNESKPNKTYGGNNYYGGYSDHLPIFIKLHRYK